MPLPPGSRALTRFRILDLTRARAGPTCARQFADFGADVIKIEAPPGIEGGANMTGARHGFDMQNLHRNTRSLTLNLKQAEGKEIFTKLVRSADVVLENYRPDVKFRLGIDYESLARINQRIILSSISGFGQDGPYRDRPGFDQIAQGMSGLMSVTGAPGQGPMRTGAALADVSTGLFAALGVMTALLEREASGHGQWVQNSLLQSGITLLDFQAARYLMTGEVPVQVGNDHPTSMPTSAYRTKDGFINIGASGDHIWARLATAIGRADLLGLPDYANEPDRANNRVPLNAAINDALAAKTSAEWIDILNQAGVPSGPIYTIDQVFADPQVIHEQASTALRHPVLGEIRLVNQAVKLSRTPAALTTPTPEIGQHTDEILRELGFSASQAETLRTQQVV